VLLLPENNALQTFILMVFVYRFILQPTSREPLLGTFHIFYRSAVSLPDNLQQSQERSHSKSAPDIRVMLPSVRYLVIFFRTYHKILGE
jgi:hypothetical protein